MGAPLPEEGATRRRFMALGLWTAVGMMLAASALPVFELVSKWRGREKRLAYYFAASLEDLPESGIKKVELNLRGGDRPDTRVFVRQMPGGELTAFSAICTHLGCLVNFNRVKGEFICPCHGGIYDLDGNVVAGPPPAPLKRLPVKIEGGKVLVGFMV